MPNGVYLKSLNKGKHPAILKVIIREAVQHGHCTMPTHKLADVAMCSRSTVYNAIKFATEAGLITVKDSTITLDPAWLKYLRDFAASGREEWQVFCEVGFYGASRRAWQ